MKTPMIMRAAVLALLPFTGNPANLAIADDVVYGPSAQVQPPGRVVAAEAQAGPRQKVSATACPHVTLRINEISPRPASGGAEWVELWNSGSDPVDARRMELVLGNGGTVVLPATLQEVPPSGFILILLDGLGPDLDDLSFEGDSLATLHSSPGQANPLSAQAGFLALYRNRTRVSRSLLSFVAWGGPPGPGARVAVDAGKWSSDRASIPLDGGAIGQAYDLNVGGSLGLGPGVTNPGYPSQWTAYEPLEATPGFANVCPAPSLSLPSAGMDVEDARRTFSWMQVPGAIGYQFQLCNDASCLSVVVNVDNLEEPQYVFSGSVPGGQTYFWRARATLAGGSFGPWSRTRSLSVEGASGGPPPGAAGALAPTTDLGVTPLAARKDSRLLCLDGCEEIGTHHRPWDSDHLGLSSWSDHERMYCTYTATTMINHFFGGSILRDEVAYSTWGGGSPEGGLAHNQGATAAQITTMLAWALTTTADKVHCTWNGTVPSEDDIRGFVNAGRPLLWWHDGHVVVVDGYRNPWYSPGTFQMHLLNTDNNGTVDWTGYPGPGTFRGFCVPETGLAARATDPAIAADSDGDGISDFDEVSRFHTNPNATDADNDGVHDKQEIASYTFRTPRPNIDIDGDSIRPEMDPDSDGGGVRDGQEDRNGNGKKDIGEGDVFDPADDLVLDIVFLIDTTGSMYDDIAQVKAQAVDIVQRIASLTSDFRIAVVDYRDFPVSPYGAPGDYPFHDVLSFSRDSAQVVTAIQSLNLGNGLDWDESVYSAFMHVIDGSSLGGWRGEPIAKIVIQMCDAPGHDPEPFTGYTLSSVASAALAADPVTFWPVVIGSDGTAWTQLSEIANRSGGQAFHAADASQVVSRMMEAISSIGEAPQADAGGPYSGSIGVPILFDAGGSLDPEGCTLTQYDWDWNGDSLYDETVTTALVEHAFNDRYEGVVNLRVTDVDGLRGTASVPVAVGTNRPPTAGAGPNQASECLEALQATVGLNGSGSSDLDSTPGTNDDIASFVWTEGGATVATGETASASFVLGSHEVLLTVTDHAGAQGTDTVGITVQDTMAPSGSITFPSNGQCLGPAVLPVIVTDNFTDQCDPNLTRTYTPGPGATYDSHGAHAVSLTVVDSSGNHSAEPATVQFTIDTRPPVVAILSPPDRTVLTSTTLPFGVVFAATDDDGATGGVVHEVIKLQNRPGGAYCTIYDGSTYGDGDGLLSDEGLQLTQQELCRVTQACGFTSLSQPVLRVEATDCGGNTGVDAHRFVRGLKLMPGICGAAPISPTKKGYGGMSTR